jgi:hypothetical protein
LGIILIKIRGYTKNRIQDRVRRRYKDLRRTNEPTFKQRITDQGAGLLAGFRSKILPTSFPNPYRPHYYKK